FNFTITYRPGNRNWKEPILPPALIVKEDVCPHIPTAVPYGLSSQSTGLWTSSQPTDPLAPPSSVLVCPATSS
ncbi:hypothetical protein M9458_025201, partial [Cirrhinus mrigala]